MKSMTPDMPDKLGRCAFELFAERGFGGVNLDDVAKRAGVTKGSLYWHYDNKQQLVLAACNHYYRDWHEQVHTVIAPHASPSARLGAALRFSVRSCVVDARNRLFTTGVFKLLNEDKDVCSSWGQFYSAVREFFVGLILAAQAAGEIPASVDARRSVDLMLEAIEGIKLRAAFEPHIADPAEQKATVAQLLGIFGVKDRNGTANSIPVSTDKRRKNK